ncbi:small GTP-binding [Chlorella sorokiniana]|uniref:Small GTP-binding n=1 Tax=Chlorella sorokiniana TaxID=3076 RepID=A0A2P6TGP1_CHLSO|nr:small GTP-binding [Chlorella sorokiniana]|eukprot:PRW33270.1 small GTP-binding [Chlorella sorokiniana]
MSAPAAPNAAAATAVAAGASAHQGRAAPFDALPDELVLAVLKQLQWFKGRFRSAALVCKRFHRLLLSPSLLDHLHFELPGGSDDMQRTANMVATWLCRHATGKVTRLRLASDFPLNPGMGEDIGEASDVLDGLLALIPALNSNGQLEHLAVTFCAPVTGPVPTSALWAFAMRSLKSLELDYTEWGGCIMIQLQLALLTGLHTLKLTSTLLEFPAGNVPCFPPALTRLSMHGFPEPVMPPQMSSLSQLRSLQLDSLMVGPQAYRPLQALQALKRLDNVSTAVPACLSSLSGLDTLTLDTCTGRREQVAAATEAALPHLTALTQLVLGAAPAVPAALTALTNLARFGWTAGSGRDNEKRPKPDSLQLPGGAWLAGLQELSAPSAMLDASLAELAPTATPSLRQVSVPGFSDNLLPVQGRILAWASTHPGMRRLDINWVRSEGTLRALVAALDRNAALSIGFGSGSSSGQYLAKLWPEAEQA